MSESGIVSTRSGQDAVRPRLPEEARQGLREAVSRCGSLAERVELLQADQAERWQRGEAVAAEAYLELLGEGQPFNGKHPPCGVRGGRRRGGCSQEMFLSHRMRCFTWNKPMCKRRVSRGTDQTGWTTT